MEDKKKTKVAEVAHDKAAIEPRSTNPTAWIFLRGLVRGRGHWGDFGERFSKHFPNDTYEMIDLPGNGERGDEKSPWRLADYVPAIRSHSKAISEGRRVNLLALSLGGMIAVEWLQHFPQDLNKVYLVCTSTEGSEFYERFRPMNYLNVLRLAKPHGPERHEELMLALLSNSPARQKEVAKSLIEYSAAHPIRGSNFVRQVWAASKSKFPAKVPGEPGSVELIGSYGDRLVSPQCTLGIAKKWGLVARMHPWAGHDIPIDDPDWLLDQMVCSAAEKTVN